MDPLITEAIALASGGLLSPIPVALVILLLGTERGVLKASAFFLGHVGAYTLLGVLILLVGRSLGPSTGDGWMSYVGPLVLLALGLLLLVTGIRKARQPKPTEPTTPAWMASLDAMSTQQALRFGGIMVIINPKNMGIFFSAVALLAEGNLTAVEAASWLALIVTLFCVVVGAPIALCVGLGARSTRWLAALRAWLERHDRALAISIMLSFGGLFIVRGISGLV